MNSVSQAARKASEASGRREQRRARRRGEILGAAIALFAGHPPEAVSMEVIARQAEVATGTLYTYFPNKEMLFKAAAHELLLQLRPRVMATFEDRKLSPLERIASFLQTLHAHIERHRSFFQTIARLGLVGCDHRKELLPDDAESSPEAVFREVNQAATRCLAEAQQCGQIRSDIPAEVLSFALRGLGRGLTEFRHSEAESGSVEEHAAMIFELFVHGATPRSR